MMKRIALGIEYIGTAYHGWQSQTDLNTIQGQLEQALSRVANMPITVKCAGRTDSGVHSLGQVIHFDTEVIRTERAWTMGANAYLPHDIRVQWAKEVDNTFHARFSALSRRYNYYIYNQPIRSALLHKRATWHYYNLNLDLMRQGAKHLLGKHDFSAFRSIECQAKTTIREIQTLTLEQQNNLICMDIKANAFLHHMVRNIIGVLYKVGEGIHPPEWVKEVLESRCRQIAGITAPADGLYLVEVEYPGSFGLPERSNLMIFG